MKHQQKISEKFEGELNRMEKLKQQIKKVSKRKENFVQTLKLKVKEEQMYDILYQKQIQEWEEHESMRIEQEKASKRKEFLKQKRLEYDQKYKAKSTTQIHT